MTTASSRPEPSNAPLGGSGFRDPVTRSLLGHAGFTTPALEAIVGTSLAVRVLQQYDTDAWRLPTRVADALHLSKRDQVLVRRSELTDGERTVSTNLVFAVRGRAADYGVDDDATPIGRSLMSRGAQQQRHILRVALGAWPDGRSCAARSYVMLIDGQPVCYIREFFSPDLVLPGHRDPRGHSTWDDEPQPSVAHSPVQ
ncbi:chorismate pyruvate-lyase family protein [Nocardia carnea]|uniref:chorismate pyruvate-lyase family protein n=1 Tax=Nocardia carnea TaxID=37328 RepID=UPI0024582192|nr:chorismate pyruvate-lyase family protein [Nocardia carnea]